MRIKMCCVLIRKTSEGPLPSLAELWVRPDKADCLVNEGWNFFRSCCKLLPQDDVFLGFGAHGQNTGYPVYWWSWTWQGAGKEQLQSFYLFCYSAFKHILSWALENLSEKPLSLGGNTKIFLNSRSISIRTSNSHPIEDFHRPAWTCSSGNLEEWGAGMVSFITMFSPHLLLYSLMTAWIPTLTQSSDGVEMGGERKAREVSLDL